MKGRNILLVDDDPATRETIKLLLSIDRHSVTEAGSGHEALQLFTGSRYDLVITDYLMPEMLGDELAQNIKNLEPSQPILMVTAWLEKLANTGKPTDAVLSKPFSIDDLRKAMAGSSLRPGSTPSTGYTDFFTRADLQNRASTSTKMLDEILGQKHPVKTLRG